MPFRTTGLVGNDFYVLGLPWSASYLLDGTRPVLFESGFSCAGRLYEEEARTVLGDRLPEILFLTHVHYDHCGATDYLKRAFPGLKVAASGRAAAIMERPNAHKLMMELSRNALSLAGSADPIDPSKLVTEPFRPFGIDIIVDEGQTVELGDATVHVLATPGHTRDMLSYYIPEKRILVATESTGCQDRTGRIISEFLVDYDAYLSNLKRLASLPVDILCQGHHIVWTGVEEIRDFFARSIDAVERFREKVERFLNEDEGSIDRVVARVKAEEYDTNTLVKQPEAAYLLNLRTQVAHLAGRMRKG